VKLRIHFAGVGGQGTQTASRILGEAAMGMDIPVRVAALHGMAQRGGAVTNQVLIGDVSSPVIEPGEADVLMGFEPMETARSVALVGPSTLVIASTARIVPYVLTASGGTYPDVDSLLAPVSELSGALHRFDAAALAREAGNVRAVGPVMLGALAAFSVLPFDASRLRGAVADLSSPERVPVNLRAFDLGRSAMDQTGRG
jgi:indolepyruvate ferredoxin oxidoreductase beta subunit